MIHYRYAAQRWEYDVVVNVGLATIKAMGLDGWELVSIDTTGSDVAYWFKRPLMVDGRPS